MVILTLRTDKPEAEIGIFDELGREIGYETWQAHRQLSETIHKKIDQLLNFQGLTLEMVQGVVFYEGPGSFTGLRIGAAVANALAGGLGIPVVSSGGENWIRQGAAKLAVGTSTAAIPFYDSEAKTTEQKK